MKKQIAIELCSVTKSYILHHQKPTLSEQIMRGFSTERFTALHEVSLKIFSGEKVGIIGKNGSGKTTLLKIIAKISTPNKGTVFTSGKVVSLIDLEAGFHPDLTGEENIYLNGLVIGMTRKEIKENFRKIISFAEIGKFIDTPIYTYSQGMKLRLGFAIAIHSNPDILILDEGIMVGDQKFQEKVGNQINLLFKQGKTILVVSHSLGFIKKYCKRIIQIEKGKIKHDGTSKVIAQYVLE